MKGLRRFMLVAAATAGLALSLTGCSKTVDFLQYADMELVFREKMLVSHVGQMSDT